MTEREGESESAVTLLVNISIIRPKCTMGSGSHSDREGKQGKKMSRDAEVIRHLSHSVRSCKAKHCHSANPSLSYTRVALVTRCKKLQGCWPAEHLLMCSIQYQAKVHDYGWPLYFVEEQGGCVDVCESSPVWLQTAPPTKRWDCGHLSDPRTSLWCASAPRERHQERKRDREREKRENKWSGSPKH